jgi:DNA recombination protein RmuC
MIVLILINIFISVRKSKDSGSGEFENLEEAIRTEFQKNREESSKTHRENREETAKSFTTLGEANSKSFETLTNIQSSQLKTFSEQLNNLIKSMDDKIKSLLLQLDVSAKDNREELSKSLKSFEDKFSVNVKEFNEVQKQKFDDLSKKQEGIKNDTELKLKEIRETVENKLKTIQEENSKKLDEMRKTVDEKLQESVEKRFNESFKLISERLEQVQRGLGEMQTLATGVGDLKKVLTNVKTRGSLGEIQLGAILEQVLSPEQFLKNAQVKDGSSERVEFAIKLPGRDDSEESVLLPIDSKFPNEDYQRLLEAYENLTNLTQKETDAIIGQFESSVKKNAKNIKDKYINPPMTTDFAIMFVPTEGLYAEILRRTGLFEFLQRDYKVTVVGPTNLAAFLSSLQMGFRTLAIEKRSSEVWEVLGAIKTEFGKFGEVLDNTRRKLLSATNEIDTASKRTRAIERKLKTVQSIPESKSKAILGGIIESDKEALEIIEVKENDEKESSEKTKEDNSFEF